jgi:hypothetical protein
VLADGHRRDPEPLGELIGGLPIRPLEDVEDVAARLPSRLWRAVLSSSSGRQNPGPFVVRFVIDGS